MFSVLKQEFIAMLQGNVLFEFGQSITHLKTIFKFTPVVGKIVY